MTGSIEGEGLPERIVTYTAKEFHFAPEPPDDSIILATYAAAVERGFESLGPGELDHYLATTPYPVDRHRGEPGHRPDPGRESAGLVSRRLHSGHRSSSPASFRRAGR